ncbi:MAG TPA: ATP-binding protein [Ornithinibacter sp.]|nr:ATP-binding protein [Ornithinibacter sp.]
MDPVLAAILGGAVGLVIGAVAVLATRWSERSTAAPEPADPPLPRGVGDVLSVLRSIAVVLDASDAVVNTSASAVSYGLVRHGELVHHELRHLARQVRRDGMIREAELDLPRGPNAQASTVMRVRVAPIAVSHVLILAEDHTHARRVEEIRRDFVANVSHELKTPVGGISLLAEAVLDARDDPDAVERFAERILVESARLTRLVKEIVDLSRLQVADTLHEPVIVDVGTVAAEAVDRVRVAAEAHGIQLTLVGEEDLRVFGDAELLTTAVANLVTNAVNYSGSGTHVGIGARRVGDSIEVSVTDQGEGIPAAEQERIFERFYRVDAARSRATGGTGLGLAIVKHVCANHGGRVSVWSQEGRGSTFTMTLPAAADRPRAETDQERPGADQPPEVPDDVDRLRTASDEERALHDAHPDR